MVSGWLIFLGLINAYAILLVWLMRSGRMEKYNLSLMLGFVLMIRTGRGRNLLRIISKPNRAWNIFGDLGVVVTLLGMVGLTAVFLALIPTLLNPANNVAPLAAKEILVIPGVNPFVPLWYGIAALIVTLVVHEGGHGILALANKMRVKSLGLLFAIVPIGAFVEPDEQDLTESPRRSRLRVYAAGPAVNFAVALIVLGAMAGLASAAEPVEGAPVWHITADAPSSLSGIEPGDILVAANGVTLTSWDDFTVFMSGTSPGDTVSFSAHDGGTHDATLISRWDELDLRSDGVDLQDAVVSETDVGIALCNGYLGEGNYDGGVDCSEQLQALPFLGIGAFPVEGAQGLLAKPLSSGRDFLQLTLLPIQEVRGDLPVLSLLDNYYEAPWAPTLFWILINLFFWIFWMNLMVGATNILPMLPLDGGHLFRDAMGGIMNRLRPNAAPEDRDRLVGRIAGAMSIIILVAFLLQIFGPRLAQAFA